MPKAEAEGDFLHVSSVSTTISGRENTARDGFENGATHKQLTLNKGNTANDNLTKFENEVNDLRTENNKLKAELSEMSRTVERESSNTKNWMENVGSKNKSIESLNLQVVTLQGQNNIMAINISEKDSVLTELRDKILTVSNIKERIEGENAKLNQSILFLQHLLGQLQPIDKREHNPEILQRESPDVEDVFILHDSLFKYVDEGLMKNEKVTVKKTFPRILTMLYEW